MEEQYVSDWARVCSLKAKCDASNAAVLGMQAENMARQVRGEAIAYPDTCFFEEMKKLQDYAEELAAI